MATFTEIEAQAMQLPEDQRAVLASHLLSSLPAILHEDDCGVSEAMRRDAELDRDPSVGMTLTEFRNSLGR